MSAAALVPRFVAVLNTASGRDKFAKLFHYACRIAVWRAARAGRQDVVAKLEAVRAKIGSSRRVLWLLCSLECYEPLRDLLSGTGSHACASSPVWRLLFTVSYLADMLYYAADNITLLADWGLLSLAPGVQSFLDDTLGSWAWLISTAIWAANAATRLLEARRLWRQSSPGSAAEHSELGRTVVLTQLELVGHLANLVLAVSFVAPPHAIPSHYVGFAGVANALVSFAARII